MNSPKPPHLFARFRLFSWLLAGVWTACIAGSLWWNLRQQSDHSLQMARRTAQITFENDVLYRRWAAQQGGVYVRLSPAVPPNPFLTVPERDVTTTTGVALTLVNPAYMARLVNSLADGSGGSRGHLTSLKPLRPENAPDPWERVALQAFERGEKEVSSIEPMAGGEYLRLMRPFITEKGCLKCHADQGYREGDVRGGISVSVPMATFQAIQKPMSAQLAWAHGGFWFVGLAGIGLFRRSLGREIVARERTEALLRAITDNSPDPIFLKDAGCRLRLANPATLAVIGKPAGDCLGKTDGEFYDDPTVGHAIMANDRRIMQTGQTEVVEEVATGPDGPRTFLSTKTPYRDAAGSVIGLIGVARDITERKQAETLLRKDAERLTAVLEAQRAIAGARLDYAALLNLVLDTMSRLTGADGASLEVAEGDEMVYEAATGMANGFVGLRLKTSGSLSGLCMTTGESLRSDDIETDQRVDRAACRRIGLRSMILIPLRYDEHSFGVLKVMSTRVAGFDNDAERTLRLMGEFLGVTVARQRAQEALREGEARFRVAQELSPDGFTILRPVRDGKGRIEDFTWVYENAAIGRLNGTDPKVVAGRRLSEFLPSHAATRFHEVYCRVAETGQPEVLEDRYEKDSVPRPTWFRVAVVSMGLDIAVLAQDITERKRMEEALRESHDRLKRVLEVEAVGVMFWDLTTGNLVDANDTFLKLMGYSRSDVESRTLTWQKFTPPEYHEVSLAEIRKFQATGRVGPYEKEYFRKDGTRQWLLFSGSSLGNNSCVEFCIDISARKQAEARLANDLAALTRLHDLSVRTLQARTLPALLQEVMEAAVAMVGAQRGTLQLLEGESLRIVAHHGHQSPFLEFFADAEQRASVCGEALASGQRVVVPDVETSPLFAGTPSLPVLRAAGVRAVQSTPMVDRAGKLAGILTTHWDKPYQPDEHDLWRMDLLARQAADLIESARAEAALRESEARLAAVTENLTEGLVIADAEGRVIYWNPAALAMHGYASMDECRRKLAEFPDTFELQPLGEGRPLPVAEWPMSRVLRGEVLRDYEMRVRRLGQGWEKIVLYCGSLVRSASGEMLAFLSVTDITERKQAEEALRASLREKEVMLREIHHRVKNNLQVIASLVDLQAGGLAEPALLEMFAEIRDRVRSMGLVHEKLYQSESLAQVDFADYMESLLGYLSRSHGKPETSIELKRQLQPVLLSVEKAVPCGLIVNELVSNAFKHAFRGRARGVVRTELGTDPSGRVRLRVADNGVGLPPGLDWRQSRSLGLRLIHLLVGQLHASVEVRTGNGTEFEIAFRPQTAGDRAESVYV